MTDPPQAPVLPMPPEDASPLANPSELSEPEPFSFTTISQTVLKLTNPVALQRIAVVPAIAEPTQTAMQRLVEIVEQLRSPQGGWPQNLEQTPENLAPYVIEEVHEVLYTLEAADPGLSLKTDQLVRPFWQRYFAVADLIPRLLWFIARSSYDLMQLVGGVRAKLCLSDGQRTAGVLRLAAVLTGATEQIHWSLDLATNQPAQPELPPEVLVQADDGNFCKQPTLTAELLQILVSQIQSATPAIRPFLEQTEADLLAPGQDWQTGTIQLQLHLVFVPDPAAPVLEVIDAELVEDDVPVELEKEWETIALLPDPAPAPDAPLTDALIKLADPIGQRYYRQAMICQQMEYALPALQIMLEHGADLAVPRIVETAYDIAELVQHPVTWSEDNFLQPELLFDEWLPKLLWHLTRSSYEVMQLVGGVDASVLQPGCDWQTGTLRLLTLLQVQTPTHQWYLDLGLGQLLPELPPSLAPTVVIQSDQSDLGQEPNRVETVQQQVTRQIQQMSPLMALLMQGVEADLLVAEQDWQTVRLQLHLGLGFLPELVGGDRFEIP